MINESQFIYYVSQHAPGCSPDSGGTWHADEQAANDELEALSFGLADSFYVADCDERNTHDLALLFADQLAEGEYLTNEQLADKLNQLGSY